METHVSLNFQKSISLKAFTGYLIETPFNSFANKADRDQGLHCLLMEIQK